MSFAASACPTKTRVRPYDDGLGARWDEYVQRHPQSSLFHLTAWKRSIERAFGFQARYLAVEDKGTIRGVLPLFLVENFIQGKSLISAPFAVYGGICADDEEAAEMLRGAACELALNESVGYLELREQRSVSYPDFHCKQLYVTFERELPSDCQELLQSFPRDTRYMIRKAQKGGLRAVVSNGHLDVLYDIYAYSVRQLGTPVFSRRYFQILLEEFGENLEVTTIWHEEKAIAGVLSFRFRDCILPYYGGSLLEGRKLAANNFMYWEVMRRAAKRGIRYYDFGRSKLGTGAYAFKAQWGMQERPLPYQLYLVRRTTMPNFSPVNPKFRLGVNLWKRMPLWAANALGPRVVRLFP